MPSAEKSELIASIADSLVSDIEQAFSNSEKTMIGLKAASDSMKRILQRYHGYKGKIEAALEDGTFPESSRDPAFGVFTDMVNIVADAERELARQAAAQAPFGAGLKKAQSILRARADAERRRAIRARQDEIEEDEYRADLADRRAEPEAPVEAPEATEEEGEATDAPEPVQAIQAPSGGTLEAAAGKDACEHCGDIIVMPTGSPYCTPCVSHKNRWKKLPSRKVLTRRKQSADAG